MEIFNAWNAKEILPKRISNSNKGTYGKVLVLAGSEGFYGAGLLSCRAALRMGAGYVYWGSQLKSLELINTTPEIIFYDLKELRSLKEFDAILIGPGLGISDTTLNLIQKCLEHPNVILDADALSVLSKEKITLPKTWVLTPHPGEMARLLGVSVEDVQANRIASLHECYQKYVCTVLLKGHGSLVFGGDRLLEISSGNSALAKAGSGDVLSGFIVTLLAQKLNSLEATALGAYIHGALADEWVQTRDERTLLPSDLIELLPTFLKNHF